MNAPTMKPADVPQTLIDAAERALAAAGEEDTIRDAIRDVLAAVLPIHARLLSVRLGRLITGCPHHHAPAYSPHCAGCARHAALIGARRIIEGVDGTPAALTQLAPVGDAHT